MDREGEEQRKGRRIEEYILRESRKQVCQDEGKEPAEVEQECGAGQLKEEWTRTECDDTHI